MSATERKKVGRKEGGEEGKKKLLLCESTCVTKGNDNNGDARDDGNHTNANALDGKWSASGYLIGRKVKHFKCLTEAPNVPVRGSGLG